VLVVAGSASAATRSPGRPTKIFSTVEGQLRALTGESPGAPRAGGPAATPATSETGQQAGAAQTSGRAPRPPSRAPKIRAASPRRCEAFSRTRAHFYGRQRRPWAASLGSSAISL
jgi:hypothetical protein